MILGCHSIRILWQRQQITHFGCHLVPRLPITSVQFGYKSEVPMTHSLGLINLPEWLTKLKETPIYIYQFTKGDHR